jgi:hypothetical protein
MQAGIVSPPSDIGCAAGGVDDAARLFFARSLEPPPDLH